MILPAIGIITAILLSPLAMAAAEEQQNLTTSGTDAAEQPQVINYDYYPPVNKYFSFTVDGALWTYPGYFSHQGNKITLKVTREITAAQTKFQVAFPESGVYQLEVFRQDSRSGNIITKKLTFAAAAEESTKEPPPPAIVSDSGEATAPEEPSGTVTPAEQVELLFRNQTGTLAAKKLTLQAIQVVPDVIANRQEENGKHSIPQLMFKLAETLKTKFPAQHLQLAQQLYSQLQLDYPTDASARQARQQALLLDRDFISLR